jgi:hypothetical protein
VRFGDLCISLLIRFLLTLNQAVRTLDLNKLGRFRVPTQNRTRSETLTLALDANVSKVEVLVLRDRLGRLLVGLNMRKDIALRVLGLARLTRGLV